MPVFPGGAPDAATVLRIWLEKDCRDGEQNDLELALRQYGAQLTPALITAFENGPGGSERQAASNAALQRLIGVKSRVSNLGLSPAEQSRIQNVSEAAYQTEAVNVFVRNRKSAALAGLGVIRTPPAIQYLEAVAAGGDATYQALANHILLVIKGKKPKT